MDIREYFATHEGTGILSTADRSGAVNAAIYAKPTCMDDGTIAFIMNVRLSYANLQQNPKAVYLFIEQGSKREGIRLYLEKIREESSADIIEQFRSHGKQETDAPNKKLRLVYFRIAQIRPLVD